MIGVTVSSWTEALDAVVAGADYLGIGTVYATPTYVPVKWLQQPWELLSLIVPQ